MQTRATTNFLDLKLKGALLVGSFNTREQTHVYKILMIQ